MQSIKKFINKNSLTITEQWLLKLVKRHKSLLLDLNIIVVVPKIARTHYYIRDEEALLTLFGVKDE